MRFVAKATGPCTTRQNRSGCGWRGSWSLFTQPSSHVTVALAIGQGQRKPKGGALCWWAGHPDRAPMGFDDLLANVEPQSQMQRFPAVEATVIAIEHRLSRGDRVRNGGSNALTVIPHGAIEVATLRARSEGEAEARMIVLQGIGDHVVVNAPQLERIRRDGG